MPSLILWGIAGPVGLYLTFLGLGITAYFQRHFLYAHKFNTLWWNDVNEPQKWGFAKNQVTPFSLNTTDGETLYAWHVLPLPAYLKHETELVSQPGGFVDDFTQTEAFRILKEDPNARLILSFHGNAGHIAEDWRPGSYHTLTDATTYHVLSIDYRGFGHSTGSPDEAGLILDASALIDFAINTGGIPASRIVLVGQSLGTAVVSGAVERYAADGVDFAGVVLVAAFSSLPTMLSQYSIAGWVPVLRPLAVCPPLLRYALTRIVDRWDSASRLADAARLTRQRDGQLRLFLVHAANDWDIPCTEDDKIFAAVVRAGEEYVGDDLELAGMKEERTIWGGADAFVSTWQLSRDVVVRQERFPYGGHNAIISYAPVTAAIAKAFEM